MAAALGREPPGAEGRPRLRVDLTSNGIAGGGAAALVAAPRVANLVLFDNPLGDEGALALVDSLRAGEG